MKKSGYRTILHIYLIFFLVLLGTLLAAVSLFFFLITIRHPNGSVKRSDWPKAFTEDFKEQIIFVDNVPKVKDSGILLLQENDEGLQIITPSGHEIYHYQSPEYVHQVYSTTDLLKIYQTGRLGNEHATILAGSITVDQKDFAYLLHFPMNITKVTMFLNGDRFLGGKAIILTILTILLFAVMVSGLLYGFWTTRAMKQLTVSIRDIALRRYVPVDDHSALHDLYHSLNTLDEEIRASDQIRMETERIREEWIANITHDLKTPLSPIKGYAELLLGDGWTSQECKRYAGIMLKNASYIETLINDLKLTYQLENGMVPIKRVELNMVRFLKELVIDILNTPEFENRIIHFESNKEIILYPIDQTLFARAVRNLIINAFVHGQAETQVTLRIIRSDTVLKIFVTDNGKGLNEEDIKHLFDRYYRGTSTGQQLEGTGLGLAITKNMIELHNGTISVFSTPNAETTFQIEFPCF